MWDLECRCKTQPNFFFCCLISWLLLLFKCDCRSTGLFCSGVPVFLTSFGGVKRQLCFLGWAFDPEPLTGSTKQLSQFPQCSQSCSQSFSMWSSFHSSNDIASCVKQLQVTKQASRNGTLNDKQDLGRISQACNTMILKHLELCLACNRFLTNTHLFYFHSQQPSFLYGRKRSKSPWLVIGIIFQ